MRQYILILAMVLVSATAQAGVSRGLNMASNDEPAAAEPSTNATAPSNAAEAPKFVARPSVVDTKPEQPRADVKADPKPTADKNDDAPKTADAPKVEKPKHKHESTEARVIYELHRHGIYW
jgi:hypothetical protein